MNEKLNKIYWEFTNLMVRTDPEDMPTGIANRLWTSHLTVESVLWVMDKNIGKVFSLTKR